MKSKPKTRKQLEAENKALREQVAAMKELAKRIVAWKGDVA
jgi:hypothetical protein